ncbi:Carboxypeptidase B [Halotydeus destructor]|nr:Carboxypeptidase B [Halotydeus destructor]
MFNFLEQLRLMNPADSEIEITGKSFEGRDLRLLKIGISGDKPIIWIDGGTHAREWIGPATNMYMAYQVALAKQQCSKDGPCDAETRHLVETYDWYFQPSVNPDGYEFSQKNVRKSSSSHNSLTMNCSQDRLWRKTRSESNIAPWGVMCRGADPNRNYKANWGKDGSSGNPCSQTYAGTHYHSEAEILALTNKVSTIADRIRMFISLHSYSQIFLLPYGYTDEIPPEYDELERVAIQGAEALKARRGTEYRIGSSARILYAASGTASDWAFETSKIKYSYTFELPDTGDKGFVLPAEEIRPVGDETWAGVRAMVLALP